MQEKYATIHRITFQTPSPCPHCGHTMPDYKCPVSIADNITEICHECSLDETFGNWGQQFKVNKEQYYSEPEAG